MDELTVLSLGLIVLFYLGINTLFDLGLLALGRGEIAGMHGVTLVGRFLDCFFFSVQTFATIGYGGMPDIGARHRSLAPLARRCGRRTTRSLPRRLSSRPPDTAT